MVRRTTILLTMLVVLALTIAACGADEAANQATIQPTAVMGDGSSDEGQEDETQEEPTQPIEQPAETGTTNGEQSSGSGTLVADLGFRPESNGFSFENYAQGYINLTPEEMRRIFGDTVCAEIQNDQCILTPPAAQTMEQWAESMNGGHCYGFSVASLRLFQQQITADPFGAANISELVLDGNEALQREIGYSFVFQYFPTVRASAYGGTPNDVLDKLIEALKAGPSGETYTIGFFKAEGGGGHAVTPYAVEDRGNGIFAVLIYDNNYPKVAREMIFDRNANKWSYEASINPSVQADLYWGDAETQSLFLFPTSAGLQPQECPFCLDSSARSRIPGVAAPEQQFNEIWMEGAGDLLLVDEQGRRLGYVDGKLVKEIPDARAEIIMSGDLWNDDQEPIYYVPVGVPFNITIDGSRLTEESATDVVLIGPGYDLGLEGVTLTPGQQDNLTFLPLDGTISYQTESSESPNIIFGLEREGADYIFEIQGVDMEGGGTINVVLNIKDGDLIINADDLKADGAFGLIMTRIDDEGEESFTNDEIVLASGGIIYVNFAEWTGNGGELLLGIDSDGDGNPDEILSSADESN